LTAFSNLPAFIFWMGFSVDSVDLEVVRSALKWTESGHRATLGTVVHTWGSAPRPVGAMLVIRDDGQVMGSVSGGCVEDDLSTRSDPGDRGGKARSHDLRRHAGAGDALRIAVWRYAADRARAGRQESKLKDLLTVIERHELAARFLDMETGKVRMEPGKWSESPRVRRQGIEDGAWAALAAAPDRRGAGEPLPRANGAGARLSRDRMRSAREYADGWDFNEVPLNRAIPTMSSCR